MQVEAAHIVDSLSDVQRAAVEEVLRSTPAAALWSRLAPSVQQEIARAGRRRSAARPLDLTRRVDVALWDAATRGVGVIGGHWEQSESVYCGAVEPEARALLLATWGVYAPRQRDEASLENGLERIEERAREVPPAPGDEHVVVDADQAAHLHEPTNYCMFKLRSYCITSLCHKRTAHKNS